MVNLYTLPTYVVVLFIGVILCLFLANSVLYYYLMPQAQFRQLGRKCLEGSSLLLLMAVAAILYEVYTDSLSGIVYDEATDFWRYSTALAGTAGAVYWIHDRQAGSLLVLAASILLLPVFDDWLPGSLVLALVCLAWRLIFLFPRTYDQYQQHLTARSIQTAVDCLMKESSSAGKRASLCWSTLPCMPSWNSSSARLSAMPTSSGISCPFVAIAPAFPWNAKAGICSFVGIPARPGSCSGALSASAASRAGRLRQPM